MTDPIWWFYLYWLPKFLDARYGIKLAQVAAPLIVIYLLAMSDLWAAAGFPAHSSSAAGL
jgi:ACS family hexuronate transporter-like MFS transporter